MSPGMSHGAGRAHALRSGMERTHPNLHTLHCSAMPPSEHEPSSIGSIDFAKASHTSTQAMSIPPFQSRQHRLFLQCRRFGLDALVLTPGPSLGYLTGLHVPMSERPVVAFFRADDSPVIVLPALEEGQLAHLPFGVRPFPYGEDPSTWGRVFREAARAVRLHRRRVGLEPERMRVLELRLLEQAIPDATYVDGGEALEALRACKDAEEIGRMRRAIRVAEEAMHHALAAIAPGIAERELATELTAQLLHAGSDPNIPFAPIVAFAESTALPHAVPSQRILREGDLVLCDWGARVDGYCSDCTRMLSLGAPHPELQTITDVVAEANRAAREAVRPGVEACVVDQAARSVIERAGYGERFVHRTGHGIGLEVHEAPYLRADNERVLRPGMTFTIEPGIYLPGQGGARIEDIVAVTEDGVETLTPLPRELMNVAG